MMMYLGFALLGVGVIAAIIGLLQQLKAKKILSAPFKKTGEVAAQQHAAGPKELISAQGKIAPGQLLTAPCSGQQCIYYEIKVEQKWEKQVRTENGMKTKSGTNTAHTEKQGCVFSIDDGSGPVGVNAVEGVDAKLEKAFDQKNAGSHGNLSFGGHSVYVRPVGDGRGTGTRCIEKILKPTGELFAVGKLNSGQIGKPDGMLGKLMLSNKGRDALIGATKRNAILGFVAAGLLLPGGGVLAAVSDPPAAVDNHCDGMTDDPADACIGRLYDTSGQSFAWSVSEPGTYKLSAVGTGTDEVMRLWPSIEVNNGSGEAVLAITGTQGAPAQGALAVEPGDYTIFITDADAGWLEGLEGGAGFRLDIDLVPGSKPAEAKEEPAEAKADEKAPEAKEEAKAPKAGGKKKKSKSKKKGKGKPKPKKKSKK